VVTGTRRKKVQRKICGAMFDEPPDAVPHVRWCERGRLAAAPYSILLIGLNLVGVSLNHPVDGFQMPPHVLPTVGSDVIFFHLADR
jgi:hypothetical protein